MEQLMPPLREDDAELLEKLQEVDIAGRSVLIVTGGSADIAFHAARCGANPVTVIVTGRQVGPREVDMAQRNGVILRSARSTPDPIGEEGEIYDDAICNFADAYRTDALGMLLHIASKTRARLIAALNSPTPSEVGFAGRFFLGHLPLAWLTKPKKPGRKLRRSFLVSPQALRNLLHYHTALYEPPDVSRSKDGSRIISVSRRRKVKNLVVVAGPSSSGKSTFAMHLLKDGALRESLGLARGGEWKFVRGRNVVHLEAGAMENLVVELDIMAIEDGDLGSYDDIPQFEIFRCAESIRVFTLVPVPSPAFIPMSDEESKRAIRKCGALGAALVDFYARRGGGEMMKALYASWLQWLHQQRPDSVSFVLNDYREFRPATADDLHRFMGDVAKPG
jgi:hypothetical protein